MKHHAQRPRFDDDAYLAESVEVYSLQQAALDSGCCPGSITACTGQGWTLPALVEIRPGVRGWRGDDAAFVRDWARKVKGAARTDKSKNELTTH